MFLKTITTIMGDYALVAPISQFMVSRHDEHLCELARLAHARLVIASEPEENRTWAIGKIKQLTGNEGRIAARHMHQNFFEFWPRFKLVFVGNTKPRIASVDEALVRRLNLVPFQFQPATRDEQLKEKLVVEYPAILRWAIDGWLDLQANGRCRPAVIAEATQGIPRRRERDRSLARRAVRARAAARGNAQGRCSPTGKPGARPTAKTRKPTRSSSAGWRSCRACAFRTACAGSSSKASG